jgi:uncharacterized protein YndB with AHSA1/START domain
MTTNTRTASITTPSPTQILITREFAAPKSAVWTIWTTAEYVRRWWDGGQGETTAVELDFRVGGAWRFAIDCGGGQEVAFHGEYLEISPDDRIVWTEAFEGAPDSVPTTCTLTLTEHDGGTLLELLTDCVDEALRDTIMQSGMEVGAQQQMITIEELAQAL